LSPPPPASPAEFRPYRRFVSWFVLSFVTIGSVYLLVSVGVSIYRQRHIVLNGAIVSAEITDAELRSCFDELDDVRQALDRHLEDFHHLLAGYDPAEAQRWADEGTVWQGQWRVLGQRCRFDEIRATHLRKELEEMAAAYNELGQTREIYTKALKRFGTEQAPRLDRIRQRMQMIHERIDRKASASAAPGENKP
jgi:glutathionyl-hydroquinone reductase